MIIYQAKDAKLFIRDGKEWTELELSRSQSDAAQEVACEVEQQLLMMKAAIQASDEYHKMAGLRGNRSAMVIMDELFESERFKDRIVDRALDHVFLYGMNGNSGPSNGPPVGLYTSATPFPGIGSHWQQAFDHNEQGRRQHQIRGLRGPVTANGNYSHLVKKSGAVSMLCKALLARAGV